jgi:hypothetical protein
MSHAPRLRPAGLLAALASVVAVACGSDTIDLLPPVADAIGGGGASNAGTRADVGGGIMGGAGSIIPVAAAGNAGSFAGRGGTPGGSGQAGRNGSGDCTGPGCDSGGNTSFGGTFNFPCELTGTCTTCLKDSQCPTDRYCVHNICLECSNDKQCKPGYSCDRLIGHCSPSCQNSLECRDGRVCDPTQGACVTCTPNGDECPSPDGNDPEARICYFRRCVECTGDQDCTQGARPYCVENRCIECLRDEDCGGGNMRCDRGSGHCQQP